MESTFRLPKTHQQANFEKNAESVLYNGRKLKDILDTLQQTSQISDFGKQLLAADETEFKRLLKIAPEDFWDEGQNRWQSTDGDGLSTAEYKFGSQSLQLTASRNLATTGTITFGGDPFTISFWARINLNAATNKWLFRALGSSISFGLYYKRGSDTSSYASYNIYVADLYGGTTSANQIWQTSNQADAQAVQIATGSWKHFEVTYDGAALKYYYNGTLKRTWSKTVPREPRKIIFGALNGYVDEIRILDGVCEHTSNFTAPTARYTKTADTISLLHFD